MRFIFDLLWVCEPSQACLGSLAKKERKGAPNGAAKGMKTKPYAHALT
jgi:hypothetical protein